MKKITGKTKLATLAGLLIGVGVLILFVSPVRSQFALKLFFNLTKHCGVHGATVEAYDDNWNEQQCEKRIRNTGWLLSMYNPYHYSGIDQDAAMNNVEEYMLFLDKHAVLQEHMDIYQKEYFLEEACDAMRNHGSHKYWSLFNAITESCKSSPELDGIMQRYAQSCDTGVTQVRYIRDCNMEMLQSYNEMGILGVRALYNKGLHEGVMPDKYFEEYKYIFEKSNPAAPVSKNLKTGKLKYAPYLLYDMDFSTRRQIIDLFLERRINIDHLVVQQLQLMGAEKMQEVDKTVEYFAEKELITNDLLIKALMIEVKDAQHILKRFDPEMTADEATQIAHIKGCQKRRGNAQGIRKAFSQEVQDILLDKGADFDWEDEDGVTVNGCIKAERGV